MVGLGSCNWCKKAALHVNLVEQSHVQQLFDPTYVTNYLVVCNRCEVEILMVYEIYCNVSIKKDKSCKKCLMCNKKSIYLCNVNENKAENGESFLQKLQYCSGITSKKTSFLACPKCIHIMDLWYQLKFQYEINAKFISPTRQPKVKLIRDYGQGTPSRRLFNATDAPSQKLEKLQKSLLLTIRQFNNTTRRRSRGSFNLNLKPVSQSAIKVKPTIKKNKQIYSQICYVNLTDSILEDMSYWHERLPVVRLENIDVVTEKSRKRATSMFREPTPNKKVKSNSGSGKRKGTPFKLAIKPTVEKRAPIKLTIKAGKKPSSKQARKPPPKKTSPTKVRSRKATPKKIVRDKNIEKLPSTVRERSVSMSSDRTEFEFDPTPFVRDDETSSMINNTSRTPSPDFFRAQPMMLVRNLKAPEPEITSETITCDLPPRQPSISDSNFIIPDVTQPLIQNSPNKSVKNTSEDIITVIHGSASISSTDTEEKSTSNNPEIVNSMQPQSNPEIDNSTVEQDPEVQSTVPDTVDSSNLKAIENGIKDYVFNLSPSDSEPLSDKLSQLSEQNSSRSETFNKVAQQLEDLDA